MLAERTIMRQVREVLRLKFVGGVPIREIARRIGVAASVMVTRRKKRKFLSTPHSGRSAPRRMQKARSTDVKKRAVALLTRELEEARQQQAATADVLKIIRHSASDLQSVYACRGGGALCEADLVTSGGRQVQAIAWPRDS